MMNILTRADITVGFISLLGLGETVNFKQLMAVILWITGMLCLVNIVLAIIYHARNKKEVLSYCVACLLELPVFVFALLFYMGVIIRSQIPFPLPPGLPVNRAEIVAALAIGVGLFPAALWHRINLSELPKRIAADGKSMKNSAGISIHDPEEWFN